MKILAIDPGETMGVACLASTETIPAALWSYGAISVVDGFRNLDWLTIRETLLGTFQANRPDVVVLEDYRVYKSAAKAHIGSRVLTSELIGAICYQSFQPVSYTHLRAHETEVNLVCRLLLEKKNFFNDTATTEIYT